VAVRAPRRLEAILVDGEWLRSCRLAPAWLAEVACPVKEVSAGELCRVGGPDARQVVAVIRPQQQLELDEVMGDPGECRGLLALDGVTDPGNLGALLRSAVFFGMSGVLLPEDNCARMSSTVMKRSAGAAAFCRVVTVRNLRRALAELKEAGFWNYGTVASGGVSLGQQEFVPRTCLVLGGEGTGMRSGVRKVCDVLLSLPGEFESLNVSAFGAVMLYEWRHQKKLDKPISRG
jgi:23S rRNA (guanosine2251-2'-O)-methyltransferase